MQRHLVPRFALLVFLSVSAALMSACFSFGSSTPTSPTSTVVATPTPAPTPNPTPTPDVSITYAVQTDRPGPLSGTFATANGTGAVNITAAAGAFNSFGPVGSFSEFRNGVPGITTTFVGCQVVMILADAVVHDSKKACDSTAGTTVSVKWGDGIGK